MILPEGLQSTLGASSTEPPRGQRSIIKLDEHVIPGKAELGPKVEVAPEADLDVPVRNVVEDDIYCGFQTDCGVQCRNQVSS